jgi:plasmid stabilization system protein ParE
MKSIRWTARAARELSDLNDSAAYFDGLIAVIERCAQLPSSAPRVSNRPYVHRVRSGRHFVYFRAEGDEIVILRITHTRRQHGHL